ncbi:hypothetical protein BASA81_001584 [Batrachochytrium salamandrivorans]|nr:hypothetical protein BASA81_001584 [Batrachochytrium salamandrivorans]
MEKDIELLLSELRLEDEAGGSDLDSEQNPYLSETPVSLKKELAQWDGEKRVWIGEIKQPCLRDERGCYPDFLLRCTEVISFWTGYVEMFSDHVVEGKTVYIEMDVSSTKVKLSLGLKPRYVDAPKKVATTGKLPSAAQAGTQLHAYLESRLKGLSEEEAKTDLTLLQREDYLQAESFLAAHDASEFKSEFHIASYRHKIMGQVDILRTLPDDAGYQVYDFKRKQSWLTEDWFLKDRQPDLSKLTPSTELIQCAIQLAIYRKLLVLNGYENVSQVAKLIVFHPSLGERFKTVDLDLSAQFNIGRTRGARMAQSVSGPKMSLLEYVDIIFDKREALLKRHFQ